MTFFDVTRILSNQRFLDELWMLSDSREEATPGLGRLRATRRLYTRLHLGMSTAGTGPDDSPLGDSDPGLVADVRMRLGSRRRPQQGWTLVCATPGSGSLLRRGDGLLVTASEGEFRWVGGSNAPDRDAVTVYWPSLEPGRMRGWIWFTGRSFDKIAVAAPLVRFYVGLDSDQRGALWSDLVATLDDRGLPFSSKVLKGNSEPARPDNVVIYCRYSDTAAVLTVVANALPESARSKEAAGFGVAIGPGLSIAHPEAGEDVQGSLGMQRSELIWKVLDGRRNRFDPSRDLHELRHILKSQESKVYSILEKVAADG